MQEKDIELQLPEGKFYSKVLIFDNSDKHFLFELYRSWRKLCEGLLKIKSRGVNLPEGLSEGVFCLAMDAVRVVEGIPGANTSFDCYDPKTYDRIQVKACSVMPDLTSFGPKSVWDKIYFLDFYRQGKWDGTIDIYLLENDLIYNHKVNANQTLKDQQLQGRRPRFSICKEIILKNKLKPIKTFDITP